MSLERCTHTLDDFTCCLGSPLPSKLIPKSGIVVNGQRVPYCGCAQHGIDWQHPADVWHWQGTHWDSACLPAQARETTEWLSQSKPATAPAS